MGLILVLTDPTEGTDGAPAIRKESWVENDPGKILLPRSIITTPPTGGPITKPRPTKSGRQTDGQITHFVAGMGTQWKRFMGVTKRLKELNPAIQCISMQPNSPLHGLEGMKHMASALRAGGFMIRIWRMI